MGDVHQFGFACVAAQSPAAQWWFPRGEPNGINCTAFMGMCACNADPCVLPRPSLMSHTLQAHPTAVGWPGDGKLTCHIQSPEPDGPVPQMTIYILITATDNVGRSHKLFCWTQGAATVMQYLSWCSGKSHDTMFASTQSSCRGHVNRSTAEEGWLDGWLPTLCSWWAGEDLSDKSLREGKWPYFPRHPRKVAASPSERLVWPLMAGHQCFRSPDAPGELYASRCLLTHTQLLTA